MSDATREAIAASLEKRAAEHRAQADADGFASLWGLRLQEQAVWLDKLAAEVRAGVL